MRGRIAFLLVAVALAGCGSVESKDESPGPKDPMVCIPQDPPAADEGKAPPLGRPRAKVPPLSMDSRSDSLFHEPNPPH